MTEQERLEIIAEMNATKMNAALKQMNTLLSQSENTLTKVTAKYNALGKFNGFTVATKQVNNNLKQTNSNLNQTNSNFSRLGSTLKSTLNLGKIYLLWNMTKRIRDAISNTVKLSVDFAEITNKFEVSMGAMTDRAYEFQDALSSAFGVAKQEMMNFQSTFNNIMSALPRIRGRSILSNF